MVKDQIARGKTKPMVQVHPVAFSFQLRKNYEYKFSFGDTDLKIEPVVEYVDEEKIS